MPLLCVEIVFFAIIKGFWSGPYVDKWQQTENARSAAGYAAPL
jgi:hypothetical protein